MPPIPDKKYFRIGEVSEITGLEAYVLRFWETEFKGVNPKRTDSGQRLYSQKDIHLILTIKHLLYEKKFTIQGAKNHLGLLSTERPRSPHQQEGASFTMAHLKASLMEIRDLLIQAKGNPGKGEEGTANSAPLHPERDG